MFYAVTTEKKIGDLNRSVMVVLKDAKRNWPAGVTGNIENQLRSWGDDLLDLDYDGWTVGTTITTNFTSVDTGKEEIDIITQTADVRVMITCRQTDAADKIIQFTVKDVTKTNICDRIKAEFTRITAQTLPNQNFYCTNAVIKLKSSSVGV